MVVRDENYITDAWLMNEAKALGIISQGIEIKRLTKIRSVTRAMEAWGMLRDFYNSLTL